MQQRLESPVTSQEKNNVLANLSLIVNARIVPYIIKEKVRKYYQSKFNPVTGRREFEYTEVTESTFDSSKLDPAFFTDRINLHHNWEICDYIRAIAAGLTHREARYYMLSKINNK